MLVGRYVGSSARPMIEGFIDIPSIGVRGFLQFLIDTGSDCTVLMPADAARLKVEYSKLADQDHSIGSGGASLDHVCDARATFAEIGVMEYEYDIRLRLPEPKPELFIAPSLLGRDIINRWQTSFDPSRRTIIANVLSYDRGRSLADRGI